MYVHHTTRIANIEKEREMNKLYKKKCPYNTISYTFLYSNQIVIKMSKKLAVKHIGIWDHFERALFLHPLYRFISFRSFFLLDGVE